MKYLIILLFFISTVQAEILIGGVTVDGKTNLLIKDTDTGVCISVNDSDNFEWITTKDKLSPILKFANKYNVSSDMSAKESKICGKQSPTVAKNKSYPTRPMYNDDFTKNGKRILIGAQCEFEMIKPYSRFDSSRGYFYATNGSGFRGLVICKVK